MMARKTTARGSIPRTCPSPIGPAARSPVLVPQMLAATIAAQYPASMVGRLRLRIQFLRSERKHTHKKAVLVWWPGRPDAGELSSVYQNRISSELDVDHETQS